jgi:hypothetical protein
MYMKMVKVFLCLIVLCFAKAAYAETFPWWITSERVMTEGMVIYADSPAGKMLIKAGSGTTRTYSWGIFSKSFKLKKRYRRWLGSKGLYRTKGDESIHVVLEEGQQHFFSEEEALVWLDWQRERMKWVYTSNGLVLGWYNELNPHDGLLVLVVQVWQIYVNGERPRNLSGADDDAIAITFQEGFDPSFPRVGRFKSHVPKPINGRWYSGKALDLMRERKIEAEDIEFVIHKAPARIDGDYIWHSGWLLNPPVELVVCVDKKGKVLLAVP